MNYIREAIDYLRNYQNLRQASNNLTERLEELNESLEGYKEVCSSGMPGGSAGVPDDRIANLIFQRDRTKEQLSENKTAVTKVEMTLTGLNKEDNKILIMSYVDDLPEHDILKKLNMSRATYHRQKSRAIRNLAVQLFGINVIS